MSAADRPAEQLDDAAPAPKASAKPRTKPAKAGRKASGKSSTSAGSGIKPAASQASPKARARPAAASAQAQAKPAKAASRSAKAVTKSAAQSGAKPAAKSVKPATRSAKPRAAAEAAVEVQGLVDARALVAVEPVIVAQVADAAPAPGAWDDAARDALRWTSTVMIIVPAFLLLFNAASLKNWADQLSPSPTTVVIKNAADGWESITRTLGLSAPRDALHNAWNRAVALKWDGSSGDGADRQ